MYKIRSVVAAAAVLFLCLTACTRHREVERPTESPQAGIQRAMSEMGNPLLPNVGDLNSVNVRVQTPEELEKINNGSDEALIWTNPDDPDAEIPELDEAFENKISGSGWQSDMVRAISLSRQRECPLIVWFHDSVTSPAGNALGVDYLNTKEFLGWANERAVLLRLDSGATAGDQGSGRYSIWDINALQHRYGLVHKPSFAVITPNGHISARIDGFSGMLSGFILEMKNGVRCAQKDYAAYREKLVQRGYRQWRSARGNRSVFAKLMRYDAARGVVYLKQSGGRITRSRIKLFCEEDIAFIKASAKNSVAGSRAAS